MLSSSLYTFARTATMYADDPLSLSALPRHIDSSIETFMVLLCGVCKTGLPKSYCSVEDLTEFA